MISTSEFARRHSISTERARQLCKEGRVVGAEKTTVGEMTVWLIPESAKDPRKLPGRPRSSRLRVFKPVKIDAAATARRLQEGRREAARIIEAMKEKGVAVELFGSMKTGKVFPSSDIDLLVMDCGDMEPEIVQCEIEDMAGSILVDVTFLQFVPKESMKLVMESLHA